MKKKIKERQILWPCSGIEKSVEQESDDLTNCNCYSWYSHQRINKGSGGLGKKKMSGGYPKYYIIEILYYWDTERSPGDSLSLEDTCCERPSADADVKNSQGVNNNNNNNLTPENLDLAKKRKPLDRNRIPPNSSTGQRHKNQSYQSENR